MTQPWESDEVVVEPKPWEKDSVVAKPSRISTMAAPKEAAKSDPSFLDRVKTAIIVPESQREKPHGTALEGVERAFGDIGKSMDREGRENLSALEGSVTRPIDGIVDYMKRPFEVAGNALGYLASPITGAAKSIVGRPVEMATGINRNITGNVASAFVPFGGEAEAVKEANTLRRVASPELPPAIQNARNAGYVLPPQMISEKPGIVANALAGWGGKIKTQQAASIRNQQVTNKLAAKALGLPEDTTLDESVFRKIRQDAGKAYEAVKNAVPEIKTDDDYLKRVESLGGANSQAAQHFPNITKNQGILDLVDELKNVKSFPTGAGLEVVKELRQSATANLKAMGDPSKHALGLAQRQAAEAVDDLIDRNVSASGQKGLVDEYRAARRQIAKSYDVEGVTNPATGNVNAKGLAKLSARGKPLTDELATIADTASAFPKALQPETAFGGDEKLSALDFFGSAAAMAHGNPGIAAAIVGRPISRNVILSKAFQDRMAAPKTGMELLGSFAQTAPKTHALLTGGQNPLPAMLRRAPAINALKQLTYQPAQQ